MSKLRERGYIEEVMASSLDKDHARNSKKILNDMLPKYHKALVHFLDNGDEASLSNVLSNVIATMVRLVKDDKLKLKLKRSARDVWEVGKKIRG